MNLNIFCWLKLVIPEAFKWSEDEIYPFTSYLGHKIMNSQLLLLFI